jgi:starch-binding outer membrane protein, SusD/RagB family
MKYSKILLVFSIVLFSSTSCNKDFLDRTPEDQITADNFYTTPEQVLQASVGLYARPWFDYMDKAAYAIGDQAGGAAVSGDPATVNFTTLSVGAENTRLIESWRAFYNVVAQTNFIINVLPKKVRNVDEAVVTRVVAEARFMRALSYFFLVRTWGAVPIIDDNEKYIGTPQVPRHRVEDVYRFIIADLEFAELNSPMRSSLSGVNLGRVSKGAAQALLAKVYLTQKNYAKAREKAEAVVNSRQYGLAGVDFDQAKGPEKAYEDMFTAIGNNNQESVFAIQWGPMQLNFGNWGTQSTRQAYFAPFGEGITGSWDGWGTPLPSVELQLAFEEGDKRKKGTIMTPGVKYPDLIKAKGGYTYPADRQISPTRANIKKYVVGRPEDGNGCVGPMNTTANSHILRFSDVLLIHAEAILAGAGSTSDAAALASFNRVRLRAGVPPKSSITIRDIYKERFVEFAFEGDYWYDIVRLPAADAINLINNQERGDYFGTPPQINSMKIKADASDLLMPYPEADVQKNPKLLEPPVPFTF